MKKFEGKVLFLDRSDINTDEIIPAKYLTEIEKKVLGDHLLEDLELENFDPEKDINDRKIIVTRSNFGCGSSREHAPWALEVNGIYTVIAESFARIFKQNMFNCGMLAIELGKKNVDFLFEKYKNEECYISVNLEEKNLRVTTDSTNQADNIEFDISKFNQTLVEEGGWVEFADKRY